MMEDTFMPISAPAMSSSKRTLTAALEAGDLQAAVAAFRQDIVFHTPILATVGDEVRGLPTLAKILQTAFTCLGMPQNVEEFQNPDGRYIVTFDGAVEGNQIQIAMLVTEDAQGKVGKHSRVHATVASGQTLPRLYGAQPAPGPGARRALGTTGVQGTTNKRLTKLSEPDTCP